jgi:hypothetical protein
MSIAFILVVVLFIFFKYYNSYRKNSQKYKSILICKIYLKLKFEYPKFSIPQLFKLTTELYFISISQPSFSFDIEGIVRSIYRDVILDKYYEQEDIVKLIPIIFIYEKVHSGLSPDEPSIFTEEGRRLNKKQEAEISYAYDSILKGK